MIASVTIWILLALSNGDENRGNVRVIERFNSEYSCEQTKQSIEQKARFRYKADFICVAAKDIYTN